MKMENTPQPELLLNLVKEIMPYGKYKGRVIADIPVHYLEWMHREGMPKGKLGMMLSTIYEIKINGLEGLLTPLRNNL